MYQVRNWFVGVIALLALASVPVGSLADGVPDSIVMGSLENLYEHVTFDHAAHIKLIMDCAECHHHTTGTLTQDPNCVRCHKNSGATANVACKSCHLAQPFSAVALRDKNRNAYHSDIPGLKGAYHLSCSGCHQKMGGPTGCEDCHIRKKSGDAFYSAGAFAPPKGQGEGKKHGH